MALDLDLNSLPPSDNLSQEEAGTSSPPGPSEEHSQPGALIDVDAIVDDDVIVSSPAAFVEAKNKARRNPRRALVHDLDSGEQTTSVLCNNRNKRQRVAENQSVINCDLYIKLDGSSNSMKGNAMPVPPPQPKAPTFDCPICMGPFIEEMSTKCGHIFCHKCIKAAIATQGKCPTCREQISMNDIIRVYLPGPN